MTSAQELELAAQLRNLPRFVDWLSDQETATMAVLKVNLDPVVLHQAQGKAQFIDRMKNMLVSAHKHQR